MGWGILVISAIVVWIASLIRILIASSHRTFPFFNDYGGGTLDKKKNVLLVVAHPDDESMFFTPTINYLVSRGHNLHLLCFSIGNADGLGNIRKDELYQACVVLKVPLHQVKILDHPDLQDGFGLAWDHSLLAKIIEEEASHLGIDLIITFDDYGVSGHCNHRDVHFGVRKFVHDTDPETKVEAWELASSNIFRKYSGPIDIWLSKLLSSKHVSQTACLLNEHPQKTFHAMAEHSSQWIWFRKFFVSFSSYTYVNTLRKIGK